MRVGRAPRSAWLAHVQLGFLLGVAWLAPSAIVFAQPQSNCGVQSLHSPNERGSLLASPYEPEGDRQAAVPPLVPTPPATTNRAPAPPPQPTSPPATAVRSAAPATEAPTAPPSASPAPATTDKPPSAPGFELGVTRYTWSDGFGGGRVNAVSVMGLMGSGALRIGAGLELGFRDYSLGRTDYLLRGTGALGYQQLSGLGPLAPFVAATISGGIMAGERFRLPAIHTYWAWGGEGGVMLRLIDSFYVGGALGLIQIHAFGTTYRSAIFRITLGY